MTRARTLKTTIRARMAKTGERYTAARRHVLAAVAAPAAPAPAPRRAASPATDVPRGVSDARIVALTGHDLAHWFGVLDRFDAVARGHTAAARHLHEAHAVPGWHAQGITVAYERARGLRAVNQRTDGAFEFGVSKIVAAPLADVRAALVAPRRRTAWTRELDGALVAALTAGVSARSGRGFVPRSQGQTSVRFPWAASAVEILLTPRPDGRTTVVVTHAKLASKAALDAHRPRWKAALEALAALWTPGAARGSARRRRTPA